MKFSVLISLYHKESPFNLIQCLNSLEQQTLKADEIVIVFDGPIGSELTSVVDEYIHVLNIKVKKLNMNVGLGNALNYGLKFCTNRLVARMDTDDICLPNRFERQINFFKVNDNVALLGTSIIEFDDSGGEYIKSLPCDPKSIRDFSRYKNPFNHMTVMFDKHCIDNVGGYQDHYYMEDYNLWLRLISKNYYVTNLSEVLVKARVGRDMLVRRRGIKYIKSECKLLKIKIDLGITTIIPSIFIFILRVLPRIAPIWFLKFLYHKDRSKNLAKGTNE